ncbi:hypothetical protein QVE09_25930 [Paenibacillus sp. ClWae2A]|uniref:hypothetical protein n=1 Tax=Paenibacillus sp. ClWae2A TaxID=3057177 RepID=UPI0028F68CBB|nr:hypothetical protein [Paenibacillus sp. ClWae2A]MDT9722346.1 hypothetical protein [Paenibacillus sp. ClWae2A]
MSERNDNELVLGTFTKAFAKQKDVTGLIIHSDQGLQYTSHAYHDMLPEFGDGRILSLSYPNGYRSTKQNRKIYPFWATVYIGGLLITNMSEAESGASRRNHR